MDLKDTYNAIAKDWHLDHLDDDWWVAGTTAFAELLPSGAHVLDIGCGSGLKSKFLIDKGLRVTGIDFSENLLAIARETAPTATFMCMDMRTIESLPETYDALFAQASLLHIPRVDALEVVRGWITRLKPGGFIYLAVKEVKAGRSLEENLKETDYGYEYERFFSYYTMEEMESLIDILGFDIVYRAVQTPNNRWIQLIGKQRHHSLSETSPI